MDKNTWIGFLLIAAIVVGFSLLNRPSKEELEAQRHYQDSITAMHQLEALEAKALRELETRQQDTAIADAESLALTSSRQYGSFASAAMGKEEMLIVETDLLRLVFTTKGGELYSAELKEYTRHDSAPLILFSGPEKQMNMTLVTDNNRVLHTEDLYFDFLPVKTQENGDQVLTMRLYTAVEDAYMDFVYTLPRADYMIHLAVVPHNMQSVLAQNMNSLDLSWKTLIRQQERGRKFEDRYATLQYKFMEDDTENLSESKTDTKKITNKLKWIAFKDQFFSTVLIADDAFVSSSFESEPQDATSNYIKKYNASTALDFDPTGKKITGIRMFLGPNKYSLLKAYDEDKEDAERLYLKSLIPMGWKIVSWICYLLVIPMFDLFTSWGMHIGWVIFLMTFVIKLIILPFTWSSYKSSAKMRCLKPEIDEINAKYPPEKMQERQQATMALYRKLGVNPMSGCLPMLFQFPVVMAMFWFFPTSIELRGQSLFWADDLSSYDAILTWNTYIPLISWAFNNHISLFCLLMTAVNVIYTYINMQNQAGNEQMKMMKWMMYLMPVFFMFIFNDYAAGLSYYYFLSLLLTIVQTMIFRWTIDDEKLHKELLEKSAKRAQKPKSGFMARLEKMQREQQAYARERAKNR